MPTYAIVDNYTKEVINKHCYITSGSTTLAIAGFKKRWRGKEPGIPSPLTLVDNLENSYWDIIEVPGRGEVPPNQMDRMFEASDKRNWNERGSEYVDYEIKSDRIELFVHCAPSVEEITEHGTRVIEKLKRIAVELRIPIMTKTEFKHAVVFLRELNFKELNSGLIWEP